MVSDVGLQIVEKFSGWVTLTKTLRARCYSTFNDSAKRQDKATVTAEEDAKLLTEGERNMGGAWQTPNPPNASPPFSAYIFNSRIGNVPQTAAIRTVTVNQAHFDRTIKLAKNRTLSIWPTSALRQTWLIIAITRNNMRPFIHILNSVVTDLKQWPGIMNSY